MNRKKTMRKIMITVPDDLLSFANEQAANGGLSRSEIIRASLKNYLDAAAKEKLRQELKEGYLAGAKRDMKITTEFSRSDNDAARKYGGKY